MDSMHSVGGRRPGALTRMAPKTAGAKTAMRVIGGGLMVLGIVLCISGWSRFTSVRSGFGGFETPGGFPGPEGFGGPSPSDSFGRAGGGIGLLFGGGVCVMFGGTLLYWSFLGKLASYVAQETQPAFSTLGEGIAAGWARGSARGATQGQADVQAAQEAQAAQAQAPSGANAQPGGAAGGHVVKIRCRNCGYLDSEDATYCSQCGQKI